MNKVRAQWVMFAGILTVVVISMVVANRWIAAQVNGVKQGHRSGSHPAKQPGSLPSNGQKSSIVKINPLEDPLMPRQKKSSPPIKKILSNKSPAQEIYEVPSDKSILAQ